jgi:excisionase family DNA binding protein
MPNHPIAPPIGCGLSTGEQASGLPAVLSVEQAAEFLGLSLGSTYAYVRNGTIPARQVGRRWLISREALVAWLSSADGASAGLQPPTGPAGRPVVAR